MGAVELRTEIAIDAPPSAVWSVLTDFDGYRDWNPMVVDARGDAVEGGRATLRFRSTLGIPLRFEVRIVCAETGRELRWIGDRLGISGEHYFVLEGDGDGTRLTHGEVFRGRLAAPLARLFRSQERQFVGFNRALKRTAERRAATGGTAPARP